MCQVIIKKDGSEIEEQKQLAEFLKSEDFIFWDYRTTYIPESCLCPVDLPQTLNNFDIKFRQDDLGDYILI